MENSTMDVAIELYWELSALYSSSHHDSATEQNESFEILSRMISRGVTPEYMKMKMRQMLSAMVRDDDQYKSKLSNAIRSRFWEKTYVEMIPHRKFKID